MKTITLNDKIEDTPIRKDIYRRLRTNIEFTGVENRVICVTSCEAGDGKSSVTFNLAKSFADYDKLTLLIDADMRKSVMYSNFGFDKHLKGLSHLLSGKEDSLDVIYQTNYKNLYLIPTGVFPKNPTELLAKPRFNQLITVLKRSFDYVIIDTPPLGMVVDAAVIAKASDASILVVSSDETSFHEAKAVKNQLVQANPGFLGVVLNKVDTTAGSYGKRYGYGYGYGGAYYGDDDSDDSEQ